MRGTNNIVLVGRLGSHPELRQSKAGRPWCSLSIATGRMRKEGESWVEDTDWHRVRVFGEDANRCERFLRSGSLVGVQGSMTYDKWEDDQGNKRISPRVLAERVTFLADLRERTPA